MISTLSDCFEITLTKGYSTSRIFPWEIFSEQNGNNINFDFFIRECAQCLRKKEYHFLRFVQQGLNDYSKNISHCDANSRESHFDEIEISSRISTMMLSLSLGFGGIGSRFWKPILA